MRRERAWLAGLMCCVLASVAAASEEGLPDGELGRWIDGMAPQLARTLARHPRFEGETVRLAAVTPGTPDGGSNELAQAVIRRLRDHLLEASGVRLAVDRPRQGCEPPQSVDYVVRVEVAAAGSRDGRVHVAVVDVAESVWVSGISYQWHGRLSAAERRALAAPVSLAAAGTAASPIPLTDADAVAAAMVADVACTLPRQLPGSLFVTSPEPPALSSVALALQSALSYRPLAPITPDRSDAHWLLSLDLEEAGPGLSQLHLNLSDADGGSRQRLASVFVAGAPHLRASTVSSRRGSGETGSTSSAPADRAPAPIDQTMAPAAAAMAPEAAPLLSPLDMRPAPPEGVCDDRKARVNTCVDVAFELRRSAYLFVLTTRGHQVVDAPCRDALEPSAAGPRRYRLRVPPAGYGVTGTGPDAAIYVLAARDRAVAAAASRGAGKGAW